MTESTHTLTAADGTALHVVDHAGEGRPIVLIHGWPLSGESWEKVQLQLSTAGYRVITYDRRGFGQSGKPSGGFDYDSLSADLGTVLEGLDVTGAVLVGFSMGGGEVARYLSTAGSGRVAGAVLAAAVTPYLLKTDDNPEGGQTVEGYKEMQAGLVADREGFLDGFSRTFFSANDALKVSENDRQHALSLAAKADLDAMVACIESFSTTDFRADLAAIDVPVLILHGDADAIVPVEVSGTRAAEAVKDSRTVLVSDGPHGLPTSHPDEVATAIADFAAGL